MKKYLIGGVIALLALASVAAILVFLYFMIPKGHAYSHPVEPVFPDKPHVTMEPGDQKGNMGMYDDAYGPPYGGVPYNAMIRHAWGVCGKPAIVVGVYRRPDGFIADAYAEDNEVIWRCQQAHPTGEPIPISQAPLVYCIMANRPPAPNGGQPMKCYHDYRVVFNTYQHEYGKAPIISADEVEFVPQ